MSEKKEAQEPICSVPIWTQYLGALVHGKSYQCHRGGVFKFKPQATEGGFLYGVAET
jgi:hypothetical protein